MPNENILESTLFHIVEQKMSDQEKRLQLSILLKAINSTNKIYRKNVRKLKKVGLLNNDNEFLISIDVLKEGKTPFVIAVLQGDNHCASLLIDAKANIESTYKGLTPLMIAAKNGDESCVRLLINARAKLNSATGLDKNGDTALMMAAKEGHASCVKILIDAGANVFLRSQEYLKPHALMLAIEFGHLECMRLLMNQMNEKTGILEEAIKVAIKEQQYACLKVLVQSPYFNPNEGGHYLHDAVAYIYSNEICEKACKILIEAKCDIDSRDTDGRTILFKTLENKNLLKYLCEQRADINLQDYKGHTALMIAIMREIDENVISTLLGAKANVNLADRNHDTALDCVVNHVKNFDLRLKYIKILLKHDGRGKPHHLWEILNNLLHSCTQSDLDTLNCLKKVIKQLSDLPVFEHNGEKYIKFEHSKDLNISWFYTYISQLKKLSLYAKVETTNQLEQLIENQLPRDVLNIISLYDSSIGRQKLKYNTIDEVAPCFKIQEELTKTNKQATSRLNFFISSASLAAPEKVESKLLRVGK